MGASKRYVIIDDDKANNMLCKMICKKVFGEVDTISFDIPEEGLNFISDQYSDNTKITPTVLFLDINMPGLTGWEFMEKYKSFNKSIQEQFTIYMLSSSVDHKDKDLARSNPLVKGYISKPLTREKLKELFTTEI